MPLHDSVHNDAWLPESRADPFSGSVVRLIPAQLHPRHGVVRTIPPIKMQSPMLSFPMCTHSADLYLITQHALCMLLPGMFDSHRLVGRCGEGLHRHTRQLSYAVPLAERTVPTLALLLCRPVRRERSPSSPRSLTSAHSFCRGGSTFVQCCAPWASALHQVGLSSLACGVQRADARSNRLPVLRACSLRTAVTDSLPRSFAWFDTNA